MPSLKLDDVIVSGNHYDVDMYVDRLYSTGPECTDAIIVRWEDEGQYCLLPGEEERAVVEHCMREFRERIEGLMSAA